MVRNIFFLFLGVSSFSSFGITSGQGMLEFFFWGGGGLTENFLIILHTLDTFSEWWARP